MQECKTRDNVAVIIPNMSHTKYVIAMTCVGRRIIGPDFYLHSYCVPNWNFARFSILFLVKYSFVIAGRLCLIVL